MVILEAILKLNTNDLTSTNTIIYFLPIYLKLESVDFMTIGFDLDFSSLKTIILSHTIELQCHYYNMPPMDTIGSETTCMTITFM